MTAPGDALEFNCSPSFLRAASKVEGLQAGVEKEYREKPGDMTDVGAGLKKGTVKVGSRDFEFLLIRKGPTKVGLLTVAEVKAGQGIPKEDLLYFLTLFEKGGR